MADAGTIFTDGTQDDIERRLRGIYEKAQVDIINRLNEHSRKMYAKDAVMRRKLESGEITQQRYKEWLTNQLIVEKNWKDEITSITTTLMLANQQANDIIEGERRAVFGENATFQAYKLEKDAGMSLSFSIYDSATVTRILREQPNLLPPKKVDGVRDKAWNREKISATIARGIIAGSSIPTIAQNIAKETGKSNESAMLRYARTAMTGAQNAGRVEVMREAKDMGIQVQKLWISTLDERTRPAHQDLDGQIADVGEPFDSILGPIEFPGDPSADDANVWNCRCTLGYHYKEYPEKNAQRYDQYDGVYIEDMTYSQWRDMKHPDWKKPVKNVAQQATNNQIVPVQSNDDRKTLIDAIMASYTTKPMTEEQKDQFKEILSHMSDENLKLYSKMVEFHKDNIYNNTGSWYRPSAHRVEMNLGKTHWEKDVGRPDALAGWKTKFHEELHQLDHILGITFGNGSRADMTAAVSDYWSIPTEYGVRLLNAIKTDVLAFFNKSIDAANAEDGTKLKPIDDFSKPIKKEAKTAILKELTKACGAGDMATGDPFRLMFLKDLLPNKEEYKTNMAFLSPFTDAIGLVTGGRLTPYDAGFWGHDSKYNKENNVNGATSECFAEIGSHIMRNDTEALGRIEQYMPNSVAEYRTVLHEIYEYTEQNKLHY